MENIKVNTNLLPRDATPANIADFIREQRGKLKYPPYFGVQPGPNPSLLGRYKANIDIPTYDLMMGDQKNSDSLGHVLHAGGHFEVVDDETVAVQAVRYSDLYNFMLPVIFGVDGKKRYIIAYNLDYAQVVDGDIV